MSVTVLNGDCRDVLRTLPDASVHCIVTSPPYYGLRDYGVDGQIGLEQSPEDFVSELVTVFREARRVLKDDGTLWLNLGDSYSTHAAGKVANPMAKSTLAGVKTQEVGNESSRSLGRYRKDESLPEKNLMGIPWRVAFALQADGWVLRQDIIWHKPNPMPESVTDRCTKAHEYVFLLSKSPRYLFDAEAISEPAVYGGDELGILRGDKSRAEAMGRTPSGNEAEAVRRRESKKRGEFNGKTNALPGREAFRAIRDTRNKRSVWTITTQAYPEAHFATMAPELARNCIMAGCPLGGTVLDPFGGAGTTGLVADQLNRNAILIELNPTYADLARDRISSDAGMFGEVA